MNKNNSAEHTAAYKRDNELIKEILKGDNTAFAELMTLYKRRVLTIGMSFFKNATDAEDFVQDVFIKVFTKLSSFRGESLFSTWLTRIAYNTAVNSINRRLEYLPISDETVLQDPGVSPEEKQIQQITREAVKTAISELPENYAVCLDMYFFYDISYAEISDITGFPVNTIKSHIFRAKKILRQKMVASGIMESDEI